MQRITERKHLVCGSIYGFPKDSYNFRQSVLFRYSVQYHCIVLQAKLFCPKNTLQLDFCICS